MGRSISGDTQRIDRDACHAVGANVMDELESCSAHLRAFCGDHLSTLDDDDDASESGRHSAADIANECLALLESLSITTDDYDNSNDGDEADILTDQSPVPSPPSTETALLQEMDDLGIELESLMTALCSPQADDPSHGHLPLDIEDPASDIETAPSICTSPKMVALTKGLERRPSTQKMVIHTALRRHRPYPLGLQLTSPASTNKKDSQRGATSTPKSAIRVLLSDATFWRQHQSKRLQRHLSRQSQARAKQQRQNEKQAKAVEYRYRRVAKPCYPLAKHSRGPIDEAAKANHLDTVQLPGVPTTTRKTYTERFTSGNHRTDCRDARETDGLLCGVYLHGKRRSHGMLYVTCTSLEQLKSQLLKKFSLVAPVVNLYREQITSDSNGNRQRKYLHRVARFGELHDGDLLCATINGYDDMAILCAWTKERQQKIHHYKSPQKPPTAPAKKAPAPKPIQTDTPSQSLTYKRPPPAPAVKLWDENGRVVSICQRLPLAE